MKLKNKSGFTLVELLVVIAIIAILATLAIVALQQARKSARDAKRIADVRQMQTALELYFNDWGQYPPNIDGSISSGTYIYMNQVPTAPTPADGSCENASNTYAYNPIDSGGYNASYELSFCLGSQVGSLSAGTQTATPGGIISDGGSGGGSTPPPAGFDCGNDTVSYQGYDYATVDIGGQCWFAENLKYLPEVHSNSEFLIAGSNSQPGYGVYGYNGSDVAIAKSQQNYIDYGVLYNWYAVDQVTLCPTGWHVPSDTEWTTLTTYLGGESVAGEKMKASSTDPSPNWNGTNEFGFAALPAGLRGGNGAFYYLGDSAHFWSSSERDPGHSWLRYLDSGNSEVYRTFDSQASGCSVRCLRTD